MQLRWPALVALAFVVTLFFLGVDSWGALLGIWIVSLATILTVLEFWKGTRARVKKGEAPWSALWHLMARNQRRYGGYWIHLGIIVMAFGIIGTEFFQQETQLRLNRGESIALGNYSMTFNGVRRYAGPDDLIITEAQVDAYKDGQFVKSLRPRSELYTRTGQPMSIPSARSTFTEDFYVLLINWEETSVNSAVFRIYLNPLINWVWAGSAILTIGTLVAVWPDPVEQKRPAAAQSRSRRRAVVVTGD
jgi:cytochrome c-type biogenesis protein CcmF